MTVDVHAHFIPADAINKSCYRERFYVEKQEDDFVMYINGNKIGVLQDGLIDLAIQIADMSLGGIDLRWLSIPPFLFNYEFGFCAEWSRLLNEAISKEVEKYPGKLKYLATLPMLDVEEAVSELKRLKNDLNCVGVQIASNIVGRELDDSMFEVFWNFIESSGMFVLIHPHYTVKSERLTPFHLRNVIGNPLDTTLAAFSLMTGRVLNRHPGIKVCLSHGGGYIPYAVGRFEHARLNRDEFNGINIPYFEQIKEFYYDTIVFDKDALDFLKRKVGYKRLLLGTDYPFDMGDSNSVINIKSMELTHEEIKNVLGENALKICERRFLQEKIDAY